MAEQIRDKILLSSSAETLQRSAKVDASGCVNAAGKLGRSDKQQ